MTLDTTEVVLFRRDTGDKVSAAIAYLLAGPFFGALLGLLLGVVVVVGLHGGLGWSEEAAVKTAIVCAALVFLGGIAWAIRDFRRHVGATLAIGPAGVELRVGGRMRICAIEHLTGVRLTHAGREVVLTLDDRSSVRIPHDFAPAEQVLPVLDEHVIPQLVERHEQRLGRGESIVVRDLGWRALPVGLRALGRLMVGLLGLASLHFALEGIRHIRRAGIELRQCARGLRGGFTLTRAGIVDAGGATLPWRRISDVRSDRAGLRVDGPLISASASCHAEHFCDVRALLLARRGANR